MKRAKTGWELWLLSVCGLTACCHLERKTCPYIAGEDQVDVMEHANRTLRSAGHEPGEFYLEEEAGSLLWRWYCEQGDLTAYLRLYPQVAQIVGRGNFVVIGMYQAADLNSGLFHARAGLVFVDLSEPAWSAVAY